MWFLKKPFKYPLLIFLLSELVNFERNLLLHLLTPQACINYFALKYNRKTPNDAAAFLINPAFNLRTDFLK